MKAAAYEKNGEATVLRYRDLPDPAVGRSDVLIRVQAISIEGGDILNRQMIPPKHVPHIVGYQAAGVVEAIGQDVLNFRVGERVVAFNWSGSHASLFVAPQHFVFPVPESLDIQIASAIPVAFGTADDALFEFGNLAGGETVVIQGGAGGVGLAAIQIAKAAGARVIATASSDDRLDRLRQLGMDHGINYRTQDVSAEIVKVTDGRKADLVVDLAGGQNLKPLIAAVRYRGRLSLVGAASGQFPKIGFQEIVTGSLSVFGISFGAELHLPRAHRIVAAHLNAAASGKLRMPIDRVFPLAECAAAHDHAQNGHPFGRVLMIP